jgi:hypothetical protein
MRSAIRTALALTLAVAPALTAHADPFDGSERAGLPCAGSVQTLSGSEQHYGTVFGGPYAVADVLRNDNGIVGLDSLKGATDIVLTCLIENEYGLDITSVSTPPSDDAAVLPPQVVAFDSYYSKFQVCTSLTWRNSQGGAESGSGGCAPL